MEKACWKKIRGWEHYSVSDAGDIRNDSTSHKLNGTVTDWGYLRIQLSNGGLSKSFFVHKLVAEAFISNPAHKPQINHKDGNKLNNSVGNLEWVTAKENCLHREKVIGVKRFCKPHHCKPVLCVETGTIYSSAKEAARQTGLQQGNISGVARGEQKTAGGRTWRYV